MNSPSVNLSILQSRMDFYRLPATVQLAVGLQAVAEQRLGVSLEISQQARQAVEVLKRSRLIETTVSQSPDSRPSADRDLRRHQPYVFSRRGQKVDQDATVGKNIDLSG